MFYGTNWFRGELDLLNVWGHTLKCQKKIQGKALQKQSEVMTVKMYSLLFFTIRDVCMSVCRWRLYNYAVLLAAVPVLLIFSKAHDLNKDNTAAPHTIT